MTTQCADTARVLGGVLRSYSTDPQPPEKLPIDVNESVTVNFKPGGLTDSLKYDTILTPRCIAARDVVLISAEVRVRAGAPAVFHLVPISPSPLHECVLSALVSRTEVIAALRIASIHEQVPVDINAAVALNCVLLTVPLPPGTPDGAHVIIKNVWVAGCAVILNELSSTVTIGYNHAPAPEGAVMEAAGNDDLSGVKAALHRGGSTEEKDEVSVAGRHGELICTSSPIEGTLRVG
jgi:hypothetical protein